MALASIQALLHTLTSIHISTALIISVLAVTGRFLLQCPWSSARHHTVIHVICKKFFSVSTGMTMDWLFNKILLAFQG